MDGFGHNVQDAPGPGGGHTARSFHDEGHWVTLVEEAELALGRILGGGVGEAAAVHQGTVNVSDHRTDVTAGVRLSLLQKAKYLSTLRTIQNDKD